MKKISKNPDTLLAFQAMNRAALNVLQQAVKEQEEIPIWDGEKTVWKIPYAEAEQCVEANREYAVRLT
jgi:hypothetical protein